MIIRLIAALISAIFLLFLVFTDLDTTQRLLLVGVILFGAWAEPLEWPKSLRAKDKYLK